MELSVVIIVSKMQPGWTEITLSNLAGMDAEIILYDTTGTRYPDTFLERYTVRLCRGPWEGYEHVRFRAAGCATHDWILMLHAGEQLDDRFKRSLRDLPGQTRAGAYRIRFKNFFQNRWLNHGDWGGYYHIRLANRRSVNIQDGRVTEQLFSAQQVRVGKLRGHILHSSIRDRYELVRKIANDAYVAATRYYREGRRISRVRRVFSPLAAFLHAYILKLGFLDGRHGFLCARMGAKYTSLKFIRLRELKTGF